MKTTRHRVRVARRVINQVVHELVSLFTSAFSPQTFSFRTAFWPLAVKQAHLKLASVKRGCKYLTLSFCSEVAERRVCEEEVTDFSTQLWKVRPFSIVQKRTFAIKF